MGLNYIAHNVPVNPVKAGISGQISFGVLVVVAIVLTIFFILDTVQFATTGHESMLFIAITRVLGAIFTTSVMTTLIMSYLKKT